MGPKIYATLGYTNLEDIVAKKNKEPRHPEMREVSLLPGARYINPDNRDICRYTYPDNRELMNWNKSMEYGPEAKK